MKRNQLSPIGEDFRRMDDATQQRMVEATALTDAEIEARLDTLELAIGTEPDWKQLPRLNAELQRLIEIQADRDLAKGKP